MERAESINSEDKLSYFEGLKLSYKNKEPRAVIFTIFTFMAILTIIGFALQELTFNISLIFFSSLYIAALYLCISLGLTMTYKLLNFANFAHAEYFLVGAYTAIAYSMMLDRPPVFIDIFIVLVLSFVITGTVAVIGDLLVFKPLRKKNSSSETMMISSIGWGIVLRNVVAIFFGGGFMYFRWVKIPTIGIPSIRIGGRDVLKYKIYGLNASNVVAIIVTAILVLSLFYLLAKTKVGKALRATSDNVDLAESSGIKTDRMINITWFIGGGLAGISGVLFSLTNALSPIAGFLYLLPAFAVVVLGGIGSLKGSVLAALIIAFSQNLSVSYLSWLEEPLNRTGFIAYQRVIPFVVLIIVILIKPTGLYGEDLNE